MQLVFAAQMWNFNENTQMSVCNNNTNTMI